MHELAATESILQIVLEAASSRAATRVTDIYLTIGRLSSIVDDSVQFYWDYISQGTLCEGAQLHFQRPPAQLHCNQCGTEYVLENDLLPCPICGGIDLLILSGEEMRVDQIEIIKDES